MTDNKRPALEFIHVTKQFPGVLALDDVSISFYEGEVHALLGENGAGKSTLIKTSTGALTPTYGTIKVFEKEFHSLTPISSRKNGIGVIYQEFNLIREMSVYENIFMGEPIRKGWIINAKEMIQRSRKLFDSLEIVIDPKALIKDLSVGYQQMVEIAKALSKNAKILIMDEPSAPLTNTEADAMFRMVRTLKAQGVTIVYITHRLDEVFQLSDKVSVLRDGHLIDTRNTSETKREELVNMMVGRTLKETFPIRKTIKDAEPILEFKHVYGNGLKDVSIQVKQGEILGLGGLIGSGRTELAHLLFGIKPVEQGEILYKNKKIMPKAPSNAIQLGFALVPEDRKQQGVLLHMSVKENCTLPSLKRISKASIINKKKEINIVEKYIGIIHIKTPSMDQITNYLSGGNQQKVVLAKWLATEPEIIILDEPTRGIDVGAKHEVYLIMDQLVKEGKTLIMISSEMEELLGMADRVIVLNEGRITGELAKEEFSQELVLHYASQSVKQENSI